MLWSCLSLVTSKSMAVFCVGVCVRGLLSAFHGMKIPYPRREFLTDEDDKDKV